MTYTDRLIELARRKERILARAAQQRTEVAATVRAWQKPIGMIDRSIAVTRFLREHPALVFAAMAGAAALGRRSLLRWLGRGWVAWRAWRTLGAWARKLST